MQQVTATVFQKATLEAPEDTIVANYHGAPQRLTVVVGSEDYDRAIAKGFLVVETWNVWTCQHCGMNDSDRNHPAFETETFGPLTHAARYGHESVRPVGA